MVMNQTMTNESSMRQNEQIVYVVDPDEAVHDALNTLLSSSGYRVVSFYSGESFLDAMTRSEARGGFLLVEAVLPGLGSLGLIRRAVDSNFDLPVIVLTSTADRNIADQAMIAGALEVLEKPLVNAQLLDRLRTLSRRPGVVTLK